MDLFPIYDAFDQKVNLILYNKVETFIQSTSDRKSSLSDKCFWYNPLISNTIEQEFGFRYLGELLERYEEKYGSDVRDIRAIALAVADNKDSFSSEMFVAGQLDDFLFKLEILSENDVYFLAAHQTYFQSLENSEYQSKLLNLCKENLEDTIFTFSRLETTENNTTLLVSLIAEMLGKSKSVLAYNNSGIFSWLIDKTASFSKNCRKKEYRWLRAIQALAASFVKEESQPFADLIALGLSDSEIFYLNMALPIVITEPGSLKLHSLVYEKVLVNFCVHFINNEEAIPDCIKSFLLKLMVKFKNFKVKYLESNDLITVVDRQISLNNVDTMLYLYQQTTLKFTLHFNILDSKWDDLASCLDNNDYWSLFNEQLTLLNDNDLIHQQIQKFNTLSKIPYLDNYKEIFNQRWIFSFLIDYEVLTLSGVNTRCNHDGYKEFSSNAKDQIKRYISGVPNRKAYDFCCFALSLDKYQGNGREKIIFFQEYDVFSNSLVLNSRYSSTPDIRVKRDFLTDTEHRNFLNWVENYVFYFDSKNYLKFIIAVLLDGFLRSLYIKDEIRPIFDELWSQGNTDQKKQLNNCKEFFLSQEEIEKLKAAKEQEKLKLAQDEFNTAQSILKEQIAASGYSVKFILDLIEQNRYRDKSLSRIFLLLSGLFSEINSRKTNPMSKENISDWLLLLTKLYTYQGISLEQMKESLEEIKEESSYGNATACSDSADTTAA